MTTTRLTPYEKLPRIGSSHEYIPRPPPTRHLTKNPRSKQIVKQEKIIIAIRLSDGRRLQKEFCSTDKISDIIKYIKTQQTNLSDEIYLSSGDVPKRQFKDLNLTLLQANIQTHTMEIENVDEKEESRAFFYRKLLENAKVYIKEIDRRDSRSKSISDLSISYDECRSLTPSTISIHNEDMNQEFLSARQHCHQRLMSCSRKKLSLLSIYDKHDKQYSKFQKFLDDLDSKRRTSIRRYQIELKDYLLKRLEADQLKQEVNILNKKVREFDEERQHYLHIVNLIEKTIRLFPSGLLQKESSGVKSLISRYETLNESRKKFEKRDYQKEKIKCQKEFSQFLIDHNIRTAKLSTRTAQLYDKLEDLEKESINLEQKLINQMDLKRSRTTIISQVEACINYLFEHYRLSHQTKLTEDYTFSQKLKTVQDFILYRMDLVQRGKQILN
ncbi:unnamed protein product [Adineta steineri]|uniref:UBX domain-containing protein n=1 Tax=Adineta steineri TaxID=433720 RepID=A0A820ATG4_9BILA|nr:unnamed protein product [Adineta steineri]CAF4195737.1 unnamed protein product [Adineta steineri]